jgi:beta-lactamase superfamily II metal-dependent hydrolase
MSQQIQIRTVKVELLRTGPSHNQLLSPLTTYLGICDGAEAGIVHVPFEHEAFLRRLRLMSVEEESRDRGPALRDLGVEIARMLGAIPRLSGSLSTDAAGPDTLIHLRLVLSASELALLPFELSKIPIGATDWAEGWLSLQVRVPVVITRRTRDTPDAKLHWPATPRVLFIAADPRELGGAYERHRDALIAAVAPYLKRPDQPPARSAGDDRREEFEGRLTIWRNASFDEVVRECAENHYTHIHLLAHGLPDDNVEERSYGLMLHPSPGENEIISGDRFASAFAKLVDGRIHRPTVVTLATCDSGNAGSVLIPGASMAHVLHQAGIPLVVASQFPLSMAGSELLVNQLMPGLLRGDHPLPLLHRIRSDLHGRMSIATNDWASLVVYEALPADLPAQLETLRYMQAMRAVHIAFNQLDQAMLNANDRLPAPLQATLTQRVADLVTALPMRGPNRLECLGLRAGSLKRLAWLSFCAAMALEDQADHTPDRGQADELNERAYRALVACYTELEDARKDYLEAALGFLRNEGRAPRSVASLHWVLGQHLALSAVLGVPVQMGTWEAAKLCAETYLAGGDLDSRLWALGTLVELSLLKLVDAQQIELHKSEPDQAWRRRLASAREAKAYATDLIKLARSRSDEQVIATRKQLQRYHCWWSRRDFEVAADEWPGDRSSKLFWGSVTADAAAGRHGAHSATSLGVAHLAEELERILENRGRGKRRAMLDSDDDDADAEAEGADAMLPASVNLGDPSPPPAVSVGASAAAAMPAAAAAAAPALEFLGKAAPAKPVAARDAFLSVEMLPAGHGDCLWIEYGQGGTRHRVLVDGGSDSTYTSAIKPRIERAKADLHSPGALEFELMILTHIDEDHIGGAIELLKNAKTQGLKFGDIWFNGWKHIAEFLGALQGEQFSELLEKGAWPWNRWTQGQRIVVPASGPLPTCTLPGGMLLTLLSPTAPKLAKLAQKWKKDITLLTNDPKKPQFKGLVPGGGGFLGGKTAGAGGRSTSTDVDQLLKTPFTEDDAPHNGSSITVLAEYAGKSVLLGADAHPLLLAASLDLLMRARRLDPTKDRLHVDAFKVPHHGSQNNIDPGVLKLLDCRNYLISTDGTTFDHPDNEAIARLIAYGRHGDLRPRLWFNYESEDNRPWKDVALQKQRAFDTTYAEGQAGLVITL